MALWCYDTIASELTHTRQFRHPYPDKGDWLEQKRWNDIPLAAMRLVLKAYDTFSKDPAKYTPEDNNLFLWTRRGCRYFDLLDKPADSWSQDDQEFMTTYRPASWWTP